MNAIIISSLLLFLNFGKDPKSERIVGKWMSENKDIAVEVYKSDYDEINIRLTHARGRMERMKVLKLCKAQATTMTVSLNSVL